MVDLEFDERASNFVPLSLLREIAVKGSGPDGVDYISPEAVDAVKSGWGRSVYPGSDVNNWIRDGTD